MKSCENFFEYIASELESRIHLFHTVFTIPSNFLTTHLSNIIVWLIYSESTGGIFRAYLRMIPGFVVDTEPRLLKVGVGVQF